MSRRDIWIFVGIFAVLGGLTIGMCLLFDWASDQSPWVFRVALFLFVTSVGFRLGRKIRPSKPEAKGTNWFALGVAAIAAFLVGYFGVYRPAVRDRERDEQFPIFLAEGRDITNQLETVHRELPEPEAGLPVPAGLRLRLLDALEQEVAWMKRYHDEFDRYTREQRNELQDVLRQMREASKAVTERMAQLKANPKKE